MKIVHLSDLHLGKRLNEFSLIEDQKYILNQITDIIKQIKADAIIIAGDVYDKGFASEEAVQLLSDFLCSLSTFNKPVFIISGNHDSAVRVAFASPLMQDKGIYISPVYNGEIKPITVKDDFGEVNFYLLPFVKPSHVKAVFPDSDIKDYTDALEVAIDALNIDTSKRNVLIAHQSVMGALHCDSEDISIGGVENVSPTVFSDFDYVALGHIHGPQSVGKPEIRYCGTPLKYSLSEIQHEKSVTVIDFKDKGDLSIDTIPLKPLRDLIEVKGKYEEITLKENLDKINCNDYVHVVLTDEQDIEDALPKLRIFFNHLVKLDYDNLRTQSENHVADITSVENFSPLSLFNQLYEAQNNAPLSQEQTDYLTSIIEDLWEED